MQFSNPPRIFFYIPKSELPAGDLPESIEDYWTWTTQSVGLSKWWGMYNWTFQTFLYLKKDGFPCNFTSELPSEGIVLSHRDCLVPDLRPGPRMLLVCIMGDKEQPNDKGLHPYAHFHLLQNSQDPRLQAQSEFSGFGYTPFWPQPGLIPRDPARGDRLENVAFFGYPVNLAPELKTENWKNRLKALGLNWRVVTPDRFHDYSDVDALVAVRSFELDEYLFKPATKLHNAWRAGVPAILGRESAFRAERRDPLDYFEVSSLEDVMNALVKLRDDSQLRASVVKNGLKRAVDVEPEQVVRHWRKLMEEVLIPAHGRWCRTTAWKRSLFLGKRSSFSKAHVARRQVTRLSANGSQPRSIGCSVRAFWGKVFGLFGCSI